MARRDGGAALAASPDGVVYPPHEMETRSAQRAKRDLEIEVTG